MNPEERIRRYLGRIEVETLPLGRMDLADGDSVRIVTYETEVEASPAFEKHEQYIDGFYLLEGTEKILLSKSRTETIQVYDHQQDAGLYRCPTERTVVLKKGDLLVIDTDTYHAPGLAAKTATAVKKAIFKIKKA